MADLLDTSLAAPKPLQPTDVVNDMEPEVDPRSGSPKLSSTGPPGSTSSGSPAKATPLALTNSDDIAPPSSNSRPTPCPPEQTSDQTAYLNITDALRYLDAVKLQFQDKPEIYSRFLGTMKDFKGDVIDTLGVLREISQLFFGNPTLIQGFNTFLPVGYRIDISADPADPNTIITTPQGIVVTQSTNGPSESSSDRVSLRETTNARDS